MNKHNYNSDEISEDDFHVLGQPEKKRFNKKKVIITLLTVIATLFCATLITLLFRTVPQQESYEDIINSIDNQDPNIKHSYTEKLDIVLGELSLTLYIPRNAIPTVTIGSPTNLTEETVLAFRAANLHPDGSLTDCFVCEGIVLQPDTISSIEHKGFCAIIDGEITIGTADSTPLVEKAIETKGSFFRQHSLVADGKVTANMEGEVYKNKTFRRALCQRGNQIFVVACNDVSMHKLAQTLADLGVDNAIYLIGGHNQKTFNGWWRDVDDDIELFRKTDEYTTYELENYIVWRKVRSNR